MKSCNKCLLAKEDLNFTSYIDPRNSKLYFRADCRPCENDRLRSYRKESSRKFRKDNPGYDAKISKNYLINNWDMCLARNAANKALRRTSSKKLLTKEHKKQIAAFYTNCPEGYEVDHILPIKGKNVSGLHVLWNLQYLTKKENRLKGNRVV